MNFEDKLTSLCIEVYNKLGKNGKPRKNKEWTQLAGIILELNDKLRIVSLATGTKCIGLNSMCPEGTVLNDSHAEVLARRAFLRFMYEEMKLVKNGEYSEILKWSGSKFVLNKNIKWHFYTSQVPCGDASIIPMEEVEEIPPLTKRQKIDVHRTGAKTLPHDFKLDSKKNGLDYHIRGAVRTKPGRGDRTLSLSCSDKIVRWLSVGLQGALLSNLIDGAVKLTTIVIGSGGPFNYDVIFNSLLGRSGVKDVKILQSSIVFCDSPYKILGGQPAATSIIWSDVVIKPLEVSSKGKRLGTTLKLVGGGAVSVSKRELLKQFLIFCPENMKHLSYREMKEQATNYQSLCKDFKKRIGIWSEKPRLEIFKLSL